MLWVSCCFWARSTTLSNSLGNLAQPGARASRSNRFRPRRSRPPGLMTFRLRSRLLGEARQIDLDRRPHRRGEGHLLEVGALDPARLGPGDRADKGAHIIDERV